MTIVAVVFCILLLLLIKFSVSGCKGADYPSCLRGTHYNSWNEPVSGKANILREGKPLIPMLIIINEPNPHVFDLWQEAQYSSVTHTDKWRTCFRQRDVNTALFCCDTYIYIGVCAYVYATSVP